jgi:hypothetical protein
MNAPQRSLLSLTSLYVALTVIFIGCNTLLLKWNIDRGVLLTANSIIFIMSVIAFIFQQRAMHDKNPQVFIRVVMTGMMVRMLVYVIGVLTYKLLGGVWFNKPAVLVSLFLYLIYLAVEVSAIVKLNKHN